MLPPGERLCDDSLGLRFGGPAAEALALAARQTPRATWFWFRLFRPAACSLYWVQLRTRAIDELLLDFVHGGGRQVVVLGAGYDTRAVRMGARLAGARVFEVDHPATQSRKRRLLSRVGDAGAPTYVAWDFEAARMEALPARLGELGHDPRQPTFTLWEGVTMYLSERAVEETVAAVRAWSAPGSPLAFEYFRRSSITGRAGLERLLASASILRDEPFRYGWEPPEVPGWLGARGFRLESDRSDSDLAREHLSTEHGRVFEEVRGAWEFHLAVATRALSE